MLFAALNEDERAELSARLHRAEMRFLAEYDLLKAAPPSVLATYGAIPTDWLMCCVETGRAERELRRPPTALLPTGIGWPL